MGKNETAENFCIWFDNFKNENMYFSSSNIVKLCQMKEVKHNLGSSHGAELIYLEIYAFLNTCVL